MDKAAVKLGPSILAADFARLGEQVAEAEQGGADRIHVDIMDGHFVPNISMGAPIVASLRRVTRLPLETHLMISDPDFFLEELVEAGSDSFLVKLAGRLAPRQTRKIFVLPPRRPARQSCMLSCDPSSQAKCGNVRLVVFRAGRIRCEQAPVLADRAAAGPLIAEYQHGGQRARGNRHRSRWLWVEGRAGRPAPRGQA